MRTARTAFLISLPIILSIGLAFLFGGTIPIHFQIARISFVLTFIVLAGLVICWLITDHNILAFAVGAAALSMAWVALPFSLVLTDQQEKSLPPKNTGVLAPKNEVIFSPDGPYPRLEVGESGIAFGERDQTGKAIPGILPFLKRDQFKIEIIDGRYKFSTNITDEYDKVIAQIIRNEWLVVPPPAILDRNYDDDTLEIKDAYGDIIFQVHVLPSRIQVQGVWWIDRSPFTGGKERGRISIYTIRLIDLGRPDVIQHRVIIGNIRKGDRPSIRPLFVYPSALHLGEREK